MTFTRKALFAPTGLAVAATLAYGVYRLNEGTSSDGPRVAVIQQDFPLTVEHGGIPLRESVAKHSEASYRALSERPSLIVWPETTVSVSINDEFRHAEVERNELTLVRGASDRAYATVSRLAQQSQCSVIVGSISKKFNPPGVYPSTEKYNSALLFGPQGTIVDRYDKIHLVLFGEFVPFRFVCRPIYWFLNEHMTPYGKDGFEYSLLPGRATKTFSLTEGDRTYRYAVNICYEDTIPALVRRAVVQPDGTKADFLVNVSNDGWFLHSCELPQHLAICAFRAVENRVSIARAVNTGISGFIDPNGKIYSLVTDQRGRLVGPGIIGFELEPVYLDQRGSLYGRFGDWFALTCLALSALLWLGAVFERWVLAVKHRIEAFLGKRGS